MMWLHKAIVTVFGLGYAPKAPGTFGALGAVFLLVIAMVLDLNWSIYHMLILILASAVIGIYSTNVVIKLWDDKDPSKVVIDEFVGLLITMLLVPLTWTNILIGFILFRFFDILKPLGIRYLDKHVPGGLGVMLDDVLAGVYACLVLHAIIYFI